MDSNKSKHNSENERRVEHLENLVEKQTRTQRHLEEHSDISSSPSNISHAKELQRERQNDIDHLKNIIVHGAHTGSCQKDSTEKRLIAAEGYLNHNADRMDMDAFRNAKARQERRKEQLDSMK